MLKKIFFLMILLQAFNVIGSESQFYISSLDLKDGLSKNTTGVCFIPNLSAEQAYLYHDIQHIHLKTTAKSRKLLVTRKKAYRKILENEQIESSGFADEIAGKYHQTRFILSREQSTFLHVVLYKILLKSQRNSLLQCL